MSKDKIIQEAESLPIDERMIVIDSLLRSLNPPEQEIDAQWLTVARERLSELRSGDIEAVSGHQVLDKLEKRFPGQ